MTMETLYLSQQTSGRFLTPSHCQRSCTTETDNCIYMILQRDCWCLIIMEQKRIISSFYMSPTCKSWTKIRSLPGTACTSYCISLQHYNCYPSQLFPNNRFLRRLNLTAI